MRLFFTSLTHLYNEIRSLPLGGDGGSAMFELLSEKGDEGKRGSSLLQVVGIAQLLAVTVLSHQARV